VPLPKATNPVYVTSTDIPTIAPTLPTPTFTDTPTLIGGGFTETPTLSDIDLTETLAVTGSLIDITFTQIIGSLITPPGVGFTSVKISGNILKWGGCERSSITFTAQVADPSKVASVTLWIRLMNQTTGESTEWESGAIMNGDNAGNYTYNLTPQNISHYDEFPNGWLQYQIVAVDACFDRIGSTQPFLNSITIVPCS
jgi:hypothetical protein